MKKLYSTLCFVLCATMSFAQIDMSLFTETDAEYNPTTVVMPASPLKTQVLFIGGVDYVQTGVNDSTEAKQWHDFIGFTPDTSGASLGWVSINHERIQADDKIGDGGGMTVFRVERDWSTDSLRVVSQTLTDGRSGKFFNVDFVNTVGETGMNCGGITSFVDGRIWTAEEWFRSSTASIYADGDGVRDTADFTIGTTTPNGFPGFDGETIRKYENFNYMVEIDPREAVAVRKQYNWGRQGFEGGVVMPDNKTVYLGVDATPAAWLKFEATTAGDFTSGTLSVYKADNAQGQRWIQIDNSDMDDVLSINDQATAAGATMYNRIEWVTMDTTTGIVYMTETGRDNPASRWVDESTAGQPHAQHHLDRATAQGTHPDSSDYADRYGRVLYFDPATEEMGVQIAGGPEFTTDSVNSSVYPDKHLSNPDGLGVITINQQVYLIIQEDLNGTSYGRVPNDITTNRTCEMFLLDLSIANPTTDDLIRISAVPIGAEITGGVSTPDGKTILVNSQHPNSDATINPFPYNNSLTVAITGFDKIDNVTTDLDQEFDQDQNEFKIFPNPVSRTLYFESPIDAAIYNINGQRVRVARNATSIDVTSIPAGVYVIKNLTSGTARRLVIE